LLSNYDRELKMEQRIEQLLREADALVKKQIALEKLVSAHIP